MTRKCCVLILAVTIVALALRLPRLSRRPMHGDEAVHAIKFGELLEKGFYKYDSYEYHGPTLNYLTLIPAWLSSAEKLTEVNESTLRIVPVFCGVLMVIFILLIADGLGTNSSIFAAILTAISPAMIYYSRYYVQEALLVCFSFGLIVSGYRYFKSRKIAWAILTGMFAGLMHASKETCIIDFGALILSLIIVHLILRKKDSFVNAFKSIKPSHMIACVLAAIAVSVLFFSSFFTNPRGILDSILTYTTYFNRAGNNNFHLNPWYYYLRILIFYKYENGPVWTDAFIVILAAIGFIAALKKKGLPFADTNLVRLLGFYTIIKIIVYSAIPYKTPWCMLGFIHGLILLAGVGAAVLISKTSKLLPRFIISIFLLGGTGHLIWQAYLCNFVYYADSNNPHVYAHPTTEIFTAIEKLEHYARAHPQGKNMYIEVICPGHDYWPLPWYLRSFTAVAYRDHVDMNEPSAPLVIASPSVETDLTKKFYDDSIPFEQRHLYMFLFEENPYYIWLRPQIKLIGFVRKDLWDASQQLQNPDELINASEP